MTPERIASPHVWKIFRGVIGESPAPTRRRWPVSDAVERGLDGE